MCTSRISFPKIWAPFNWTAQDDKLKVDSCDSQQAQHTSATYWTDFLQIPSNGTWKTHATITKDHPTSPSCATTIDAQSGDDSSTTAVQVQEQVRSQEIRPQSNFEICDRLDGLGNQPGLRCFQKKMWKQSTLVFYLFALVQWLGLLQGNLVWERF